MYPKRIQSKSSVRSSSSSGKSVNPSEDVARLQAEIATLKQTIDLLKVTVESRDAAIGTLALEKEKLYVDLKSAQKTNRNLHQQLIDERDMHSKEKEYFDEEIQRLTQKEHGDFQTISLENNQESNITYEEEIKAKDQVIYNIGEKYLKMKSSKKHLQKKLYELESQSKKTCKEIVLLLQENRSTLDNILSALVKSSTVSPSTKKYLQILKNNATLHFKNTQLKVVLAHIGLLQKNVGENSWSDTHDPIDPVTDKMSKLEEKLKEVQKKSFFKCSRCETNSPSTFKRRPRFRAKLNNPLSCRHYFQRVHTEFSPYYRRHLRCSKSDSYLICKHKRDFSMGDSFQ